MRYAKHVNFWNYRQNKGGKILGKGEKMGVISELQAIGKILQKAGQIDLYQKISSLMDEILEIKKQNDELREENSELKEQIKIKDSLIFKDNSYYSVDKDGNIKNGPFCSSCWDNSKKLIWLHYSKGVTGVEVF